MEYPYNREQHQQEKEAKQEAQERAYIASFPNFQALYAIMDKPLPARLLNEIGGLCVKLGVPLPPGWDCPADRPPVLDTAVKQKLIASCIANGVRLPPGWESPADTALAPSPKIVPTSKAVLKPVPAVCYSLTASDEPLQVRYVGCTHQTLKARLYGHRYQCVNPWQQTTPKQEWILAVLARGAQVLITELSVHNSRAEAEEAETTWIGFWCRYCDLLNSDKLPA